MTEVLLVLHLLITVAMIAVILLQRSEGGALGIGGGGGGGLMSARGAGNVLTRTTAILAVVFMVTSVALAVIADQGVRARGDSLFEETSEPAAGAGDASVPDVPVPPDGAGRSDGNASDGAPGVPLAE